MFIGHWAPALAAAAASRKAPPLAILFIGAQLIDWAFFAFLLLGETLSWLTIGGIAVGVAGVMIVAAGGQEATALAVGAGAMIVAVLIAALGALLGGQSGGLRGGSRRIGAAGVAGD